MEKDIPNLRDEVRHGRFVDINAWRRDKIWTQGSRYSTPDLLVRATGEKLNAAHFEVHLRQRYLG